MVLDKPTFFTTSSRPGNFGDHIDFKVNLDNWFDENRYLIPLIPVTLLFQLLYYSIYSIYSIYSFNSAFIFPLNPPHL